MNTIAEEVVAELEKGVPLTWHHLSTTLGYNPSAILAAITSARASGVNVEAIPDPVGITAFRIDPEVLE